ncbi:sulfite exporter TauE/SafE family protein [Micromonospora sp. U56]|uniref:sulfite exporter TauE/SafE family protein n=1 Tax=Micromonospora sp. U56 TaxID=2824900 RepID=UPI001B369611|nr:sulfite exporter TauE/SafE family protein [Micromonospora sp. U56]MBQ0897029.1 sulfite exporter TauE/SafE family protein [Micromonospora sp. U56]
MNLGAVLVTGLFAGGVSCAAVQGGLLTGLVTRQRNAAPAAQPGARAKATVGAAYGPASAESSGKAPGRTAPPARKPQQQWRARTIEPPKPLGVRAVAGLRTLRAQAGDDFAPVGAFLGGKLVSHTLLGALLGAVGGAAQLSPTVRVWTQLAAGALIIAFGLAQLGVPGFKKFTLEPPAAWTRFVRGRARSQAAFAPALLGFFTILVPCGVTLSVEALALTSGSALSGAATMAVFVIGTSPLFAILGYAARRAAAAWQGRLAVLTGLVVLGMGLYTLNSGLTLADSSLAARNLPQTLGVQAPPPVTDPAVVHPVADGRQEVIVTVRDTSYSPKNIGVRAGVPTTLVLRTDGVVGCTSYFVIPSLDEQVALPTVGDTRIDLGVLQPGTLHYTCAMGMYSGQLTITP